MFNKILFSLLLLSFLYSDPAFSESKVDIGIRIDCSHELTKSRGTNQPCAAIRNLRVGFEHSVSKKLKASLSLDPYGTPSESYAHRPRLESENTPTLGDTELKVVNI